ncbi:MAG: hypothetical protein KDA92_25365 [Planctomycetales bacterium]|nr:hypothetical protein [Planctomycetales bacterium]
MNDEGQERDALDEWVADRLADVRLPADRRAKSLSGIEARLREHATREQPALTVHQPQSDKLRRRWRWTVVGLLASGVCLSWAALTMLPGRWDSIGANELAERAENQWQALGQWQAVRWDNENVVGSLSSYLRESPRRWQHLQTDLDREAIVFDLPKSGGKAARLYALQVDGRLSGLPTKPPQQPQTARNGQWVAAWQEGDRVFVLMVGGSTRDYWDRVRLGSSAVARTRSGEPSS